MPIGKPRILLQDPSRPHQPWSSGLALRPILDQQLRSDRIEVLQVLIRTSISPSVDAAVISAFSVLTAWIAWGGLILVEHCCYLDPFAVGYVLKSLVTEYLAYQNCSSHCD